ncbi:MFS transporter [Bacillus sp. FJAT-45350]|uniref:MFS transporter n=1 Tax=Bacillus sp. FJAT-45350 TaxID=2011014 RepID=UPI000BB9077F|nr:MFS transporter [Bacillus sp. FJAT-45350]
MEQIRLHEKNKRLALLPISILTITAIFVVSNIYILIPLIPSIATSYNHSIQEVFVASSIFTFVYSFGLITFGPLSQRYGYKKMLIVGLICTALVTISLGFATSFQAFFTIRGLQGFVAASFAPVAYLYSFALFQGRQLTVALTLINGGFLLAAVVGQVASGVIQLFFQWQFVFILFACIYLVIAFVSFTSLPKEKVDTDPTVSLVSSWGTMFSLLRKKEIIVCCIATFPLLLSFVAFYSAIGGYFANEFGLGEKDMLVIRSIGLLGIIAALIYTAKTTIDDARKTIIVLYTALTSIFIIMLLADSQLFLVILSVFFVAGISTVFPYIIRLMGRFGGNQRALAISLYTFVLLNGAAFGGLLASFLTFKGIAIVLAGMFSFSALLLSRIKVR